MKKIKISENSYNKLKSALINEVSVGLVDAAYDKSDDVFWRVKSNFDSFYDELEYNVDTNNPYIIKIKEYADKIREILDRKDKQKDTFYDATKDIDFYKYMESPEHDNVDYDELDLRVAQKRYPKK